MRSTEWTFGLALAEAPSTEAVAFRAEWTADASFIPVAAHLCILALGRSLNASAVIVLHTGATTSSWRS